MKGKNKQVWIEEGYRRVSENGFKSIKIESIARAINKNKSSFYHYFGDWELFEETLLEYHLALATQFAIDTSHCETIVPDMVDLFVNHKTDFFFHKQLRINRNIPQYKRCFESVYNMYEGAILNKWTNFLNLESQPFLAKKILNLISENFLLQITPENFNHEWLKSYLIDVSSLLVEMGSQVKK